MTDNEIASTLAVLIASTMLAIACGYAIGYAIGFAEGQRIKTTRTECRSTYVYTVPFKGTLP